VTLSPAGKIIGALYLKLQTQSSAPEDGRNYLPKHVELIVIVASIWLSNNKIKSNEELHSLN